MQKIFRFQLQIEMNCKLKFRTDNGIGFDYRIQKEKKKNHLG